jgi:ribonuclease BN (tRNA processing enzyme)
MRLDVAGAGPAYTDRLGASGAAYLLRQAGSSLLLDFGQGSFPRLAGLMEPADLDGIVVSHLHPDHFIDLVALRHYLRFERDMARVRVVGPPGLDERLDALHGQPGFTAGALDVEPLHEGTFRIGAFDITAGRVTHTESSFGFRVTPTPGSSGGDVGHAGPALVYSGDCAHSADLDPLIEPGDTLLCEVSFGTGPVPAGAQHLDGPEVGAFARRVGAGRVLLTHLQMGFDRAATVASVRAAYDGPVELVEPGFYTTIGA